MTDQAVVAELRSLRQTVLTLRQFIGPHLSRDQVCTRLGVSRNTLTRRIEAGQFPRPGTDGKWLFAQLVQHQMSEADRSTAPAPTIDPSPIPFGEDGHHLYRHFDAQGVLLYIGVSYSALHRLAQHKKSAKWFNSIARVEIMVYRSKEDALIAERNAIQREKPLYNIAFATAKGSAA